MRRTNWTSRWFFWALALMILGGGQGLLVSPALADAKVKVAVLDKGPKAQSAERFVSLYPELTRAFREAFRADGRFEVLPSADPGGMAEAAQGTDPWDPERLRRMGKELGADVVFASYYYEMGGHAMPMHANNVLMLLWVESGEKVELNREYSRVLSEEELVSSDALAFKELLAKAENLLP